MKNAMNSVQMTAPNRNKFDLSHTLLTSGNMGWLYPCLVLPCAPGDTFRIGCEMLTRLLPMLAPVMHLIQARVEYFFCPERIIWENFETWITNGGDDGPPEDPLPARPFFLYDNGAGLGPVDYSANPLLDYMGLPNPDQCPLPTTTEKVIAAPFGVYQTVYREYYRDENLQLIEGADPVLQDGDNSGNTALFQMRKRAWEADYFTKALPFAQKGQPVDLPLAGFTDVPVWISGFDPPGDRDTTAAPANWILPYQVSPEFPVADQIYAETSLLNNMSAATINDLRLAFRLQEWLEKNARGGTRYSELIRAHFNVRPQDARLQRPEYIVGVKTNVQISEVLNTTGTEEAAQGTMAGHGISYTDGNYSKYFCQEHGYIIGILSFMPKPMYMQGIDADWLKYTDPTELLWPTFGHLGEQAIQNREIMAFRGSDPVTGSEGTFGYKPVYQEYKYMPNRVSGQFRSTLNFWHLARIFDPMNPPQLNSDFIEADPSTRIFAVDDPEEDHFLCQIKHNISAVRALPFFGTPANY